ncbi:MAG: ATP-binding protein [Rhizonema sp. NSF051]|nr:ATP-binding protein [Rhizonema sp. NSF051]
MNLDEFAQQIQQVSQRTKKLQNRVQEGPSQQQDFLEEAFEEMNVALEELRVAEEELRAQNEQLEIANKLLVVERQRYQVLFEFAPEGYLVTDIYGKILEANCAAATLLNIPSNFLIALPLSNFIPNKERQAFRYQLLRLYDLERMQEWEFRLEQVNSKRILDVSVSVLTVRDLQGNPVVYRWQLRDITARKQAEEQERLTQLQNCQLQEAARLKSKFVAIVSHEVRNPMNVILGLSQLLLSSNEYQIAPDSRNIVEKIFRNGENLMMLIEDLLDFSKLEIDKLKLRLQEFDLVDLVTTTTEELRFLAEEKNLSLSVHTDIQNCKVVNDGARLRQVLVNLLSNAIKFTDTGSVSVKVQQVNQDFVEIIFRDTGIGMPEAELKEIFREFQQLNSLKTRSYGGTGLGLAISDKLVNLMSGTISVESKLGEGSTFYLKLPIQVSQNSKQQMLDSKLKRLPSISSALSATLPNESADY